MNYIKKLKDKYPEFAGKHKSFSNHPTKVGQPRSNENNFREIILYITI